jgi:hypothetical protein
MIPHSLRRNATSGSTIGAAEAGAPASERARVPELVATVMQIEHTLMRDPRMRACWPW